GCGEAMSAGHAAATSSQCAQAAGMLLSPAASRLWAAGDCLNAAAEDAGGLIYRTGARTDNALTDASGVSFRDSVSSSADRVQVFRRGDQIWAVDTSKLPPGPVLRDGV